MNNEYIIVNKTALSKMRDQLDKEYVTDYQRGQIELLDAIISYKSTPLISVVEKAFEDGQNSVDATWRYDEDDDNYFAAKKINQNKVEYSSNLTIEL